MKMKLLKDLEQKENDLLLTSGDLGGAYMGLKCPSKRKRSMEKQSKYAARVG